MRVAAETFSITPQVGRVGRSLTRAKVERVFSPLDTTLTLLEDGPQRICIISTHLQGHRYRFSNIARQRVAEALGLDRSGVLYFSSHNHCGVQLTVAPPAFGTLERDFLATPDDLTPEGLEFVERAAAVARRLPAALREATVHFGLGTERRLSYNRKGHRADGSTYLMREEDRLLLGEDFKGDVDDDAAVVALIGEDQRPICLLTWFTAHPVTAYHPEHPIVFGEFPQVACDDLSRRFDCVPVGFLQGCAGDINAKGLLSRKPAEQSVADATRFGHQLGETFIAAAEAMTQSELQDIAMMWRTVTLPFAGVPPQSDLDAQIQDMESFIARCSAGDENTTQCQGLNFPSNMTPQYRAALVEPLLRWARWAREFHEPGRASEAPSGVDLDVLALRLGDIGIIGMPCEPFDMIGRQIKQHAPCPLTLPCGYMNDTAIAYVPDAGNNGDMEYMSAFYRYTTTLLPYAHPAGDKLAREAVDMLKGLQAVAAAK